MGINEFIQVGNQIRKYREEKGLSQKATAELAGIPYSTYSNYENNNREPSMEQLKKIADALDVTMIELCEGNINKYKDALIAFNLGSIPDILGDYVQELGEFLYSNPNHKLLFDSAMEVKPSDVDFAKQMLDRINGKYSPSEN